MPRSDPRVRKILSTANGQIADRAIRHALFLEGYKTHQVNEIIKYLNAKVFPDLIREVKRRLEMGRIAPWTTRRMQELLKAVDQVIRTGLRYTRNGFSKELKQFALQEAEWQRAIFEQYTPKVFGIDYVTPAPTKLRAIVTTKPFEGKILRDYFEELATNTRNRVRDAIKTGYIKGDPVPKIMRRIRGSKAMGYKDGILEISRRNCAAWVRTATANVSNLARMSTYQSNQDAVTGWRFVATLDTRTTEICMALDGTTYDTGESANRPPLHFQCRSTTTPLLKSWKELGIDAKEAPPGTRASMDGQVPATMTYGEWLRNQPRWVQERALGKGKAALFRSGKLDIKDFVDNKGNPLTLKELLELEKAT